MLTLERNLSDHTTKLYFSDLSGMIRWIEAEGKEELNSVALADYFYYLQMERKMAARSIRRKYVSIQQYCVFLNQKYLIGERFFNFSSRRFQLPRSLPETLTMEEIRRLIHSVNEEYQEASSEYARMLCVWNMCIIELLFCLGLRIGEISAMNLEVSMFRKIEVMMKYNGRNRLEV